QGVPEPSPKQKATPSSGGQPCHLARKLSAVGELENAPPMQRAGPEPSSWTASALTGAVTSAPPPSADQEAPLHLAMPVAAMPPASAKSPPAYRAGPLPSS